MNITSTLARAARGIALGACAAIAHVAAWSQPVAPAWDFAPLFQYRIENIVVHTSSPGSWNVRVVFSVRNPTSGEIWDIHNAPPYQSAGANLTIDIGWDPSTDFNNTGSANPLLNPVGSTGLGTGAAMPLQIRNLQNPMTGARRCTTTVECPGVAELYNRFWVERTVTPVSFMRRPAFGRIGMEGRPVCSGLAGCPPGPPYANIPVRSEVADFALLAVATPTAAMVDDPRRQVVDFDTKCRKCHDGATPDKEGVPIPRLSLHGNNRNENLKLCVMCHNPNQTDVPYRLVTADARTSGPETPIDMKTMIHSIHAGGFKEKKLVVIGFNSSIHDFSGVRFPATLRNCLNCHTDDAGRGSFELPLAPTVLGTTVRTGSVYALPAGSLRSIDVNPFNDLKITPTAAVCSSCHDKSEVQTHMIRKGGASFTALQQDIGVGIVERCTNCHGPGKDKDVRKAHEIRGGKRGDDDRRRHRDD